MLGINSSWKIGGKVKLSQKSDRNTLLISK